MERPIDFDAKAERTLALLTALRLTDDRQAALAAAFREVALAAGDAVERAHRDRSPLCMSCDGEGTCVYGRAEDDEAEECEDCGGTCIADAAVVLGIARRA